jgi:hypothetical protein
MANTAPKRSLEVVLAPLLPLSGRVTRPFHFDEEKALVADCVRWGRLALRRAMEERQDKGMKTMRGGRSRTNAAAGERYGLLLKPTPVAVVSAGGDGGLRQMWLDDNRNLLAALSDSGWDVENVSRTGTPTPNPKYDLLFEVRDVRVPVHLGNEKTAA